MLKNTRLWLGLTALFAFLLTFIIAATALGLKYEMLVNDFLGTSSSKIVNTGDDKEISHFKSEFGKTIFDYGYTYDEKSKLSSSELAELEITQKKLVEAGFEQNINEMKEGAALMKNDNDALPLKKNARVSLFGHAQVDPFQYGVSAGSRPNEGYKPTLFDAMKDDGFGVNEALHEALKSTSTTRGWASPWGNLTGGSAAGTEDPISTYTTEVKSSWASDYQDAAIVMFARQGSESSDMLMYDGNDNRSSLSLIPEEEEIMAMLKAEKEAGKFKKIIVILNTASQLEVDWLDDYKVDACMFVGSLGGQGSRGVSSILSGETNPSGRLVDTYAVNSMSAPACVNSIENTPEYKNAAEIDAKLNVDKHPDPSKGVGEENASHMTFQAEGIYFGYKYYETRYEDYILGKGGASSGKGASNGATSWKYENEISYPFGHGLSYTTFTQKLGDVRYDAGKDIYTVDVTIKNTGKVAGKSVAQVYAQTPYGEYEIKNYVEKSAIQLVGFEKTKELQPEAEEKLTVEVERYLLASYDYFKEKGYILSGGDYYFAIGDNAHDALNNVLKAKKSDVVGLVNYDGTVAAANADKAHKFTLGFDEKAYEKSSADVIVTNRFEDCDLNYWIKGSGKYLSRNDWVGTYPTEATTVTATGDMIKTLKGDLYEKPEDSPTVTEATKDFGKDQGMTFVMMKDVVWEDNVTWDKYLKQMTLDEMMITLECQSGRKAVKKVALPETKVGDGCDGIMGKYAFAYEDKTGKYGSGKFDADKMNTTRFASKTILTMTFNKDLYQRRGELMGEDGIWSNRVEAWCVGANLHRTPFNGRAYEYMSEDANLNYMAAIPEVIAMEKKGMLAGVKHFAGNDQEFERHGVSTFFNEQAWREGALRGFEGAIRVAQSTTLMQSFNRLGLVWASASPALNLEVCFGEWGFQGHIETDGTDSELVGFMSHYATTLAAGSDTFCLNSDASIPIIKEAIEKNDDGNLVNCVLRTAKNFHYAMSRSVAINGLSSTSKIVPSMPWWLGTLIGFIIGLSVLVVGGAVLVVLSKRRKS